MFCVFFEISIACLKTSCAVELKGSDVGMKREEEEYVYMELCVMSFFFGVEYVCQNFKGSLKFERGWGGIGGLLRDNCMQEGL
jgi:hypothetical protein